MTKRGVQNSSHRSGVWDRFTQHIKIYSTWWKSHSGNHDRSTTLIIEETTSYKWAELNLNSSSAVEIIGSCKNGKAKIIRPNEYCRSNLIHWIAEKSESYIRDRNCSESICWGDWGFWHPLLNIQTTVTHCDNYNYTTTGTVYGYTWLGK